MKINFSKAEYRLLLDMIYLSDWMMHSHEINDKDNAYKILRKKILSHFKEMNLEGQIEYDKKSNDYYELEPYDAQLHEKFIDSYDQKIFWDDLADQLATRDVITEFGLEKYNKMDGAERVTRIIRATELYVNEFGKNGLDNLKIISKK